MNQKVGKREPTKRIYFTKKALEALPTPKDGRRVSVFDKHTAGLCVTVYPSGEKTFFHFRFVRGKPRRTWIGKVEELTVDQARGRAAELNAELAKWKLRDYQGDSPFTPRREALTLEQLITIYKDRHIVANAAHPERAAYNIERQVAKYLGSWRNRKASSIRKRDVLELLNELGASAGHTTANRVIQLLSAVFNWAADAEIWSGQNPAARVKRFREKKRERYIQPAELPAFFQALKEEKNVDLRDYVLLALWTGARRNDVLSMRWRDVALEQNRWTVSAPKNRDPYGVPLTPETIAILQDRLQRASGSPFVFPSRGKTGHVVDLKSAWKKFLVRAGIEDLHQHDLRRTLGCFQAAQGSSLLVIGKS